MKFCGMITAVLNLIINGLPSKLVLSGMESMVQFVILSFKPYYKWITF